MQSPPLYSIGHGRKPAELFLSQLRRYNILYLIDVRSRPFSRFNPHFNRDRLSSFLRQHGIRYVFMGDELGGRPSDPTCYDASGKIRYDLVMQQPFFRSGIERLKAAYANAQPAAIMCSESDPAKCHRTHLIGRVLTEEGIPLLHIDPAGELKSQWEMVDNNQPPGLFD